MVETLGCNYSIYKDDKPCSNGKYCQTYKIEDKSTVSDNNSKSPAEIKSSYDGELAKIKAQNRQQFFELVFKIIESFLDKNGESTLLSLIKKLVTGENTAQENYTILDENQTAIYNDGKMEGYKTVQPDGSSVISVDTDGDGKVDHAIAYDKNGKKVGEHLMAKKRTSGVSASTKNFRNSSANTPQTPMQPFNFYNDCVTTLDVKGFKAVLPADDKPAHEFLYIIALIKISKNFNEIIVMFSVIFTVKSIKLTEPLKSSVNHLKADSGSNSQHYQP